MRRPVTERRCDNCRYMRQVRREDSRLGYFSPAGSSEMVPISARTLTITTCHEQQFPEPRTVAPEHFCPEWRPCPPERAPLLAMRRGLKVLFKPVLVVAEAIASRVAGKT